MYVQQSPPDLKVEPEIKNKKNKASFIVFFVNLFLMVIAFFIIKNQNEEKSSQSLAEDLNKSDVSAGEASIVESSAALNDAENQAQDPVKAEANSATNNLQPANAASNPQNTGISATMPQIKASSGSTSGTASSSSSSASGSNNSSSKSSKKTKTS
jgi:hypothetical protein